MRKICSALIILLFVTSCCFAGQGTLYGTLKSESGDDGDYYYISLGAYGNAGSLQSQLYRAYPAKGGRGIWYAGNYWTLDRNHVGQHITITPANVARGKKLSSLLGNTYSFTYQTDDSGVPVVTIFQAAKNWLVVKVNSASPVFFSAPGATLHSSVAFNTDYKPRSRAMPFGGLFEIRQYETAR